jgi:hypothetical protein
MSTPARWLALALTSLFAWAALALGPMVAPAAAFLVEAEEGLVKVGTEPRSTNLVEGPFELTDTGVPLSNLGVFQFANPKGAPVLPSSRTYAIYWDPTDNYHGDWQEHIDAFFQNMGGASGTLGSVFAVDAQYTDRAEQHASNESTFMGAYVDTEPYPAEGCEDPEPLKGVTDPNFKPAALTCLTDAQIQTQLKSFIADHELQTGMGPIFYILTPPGVTVCLDKGGVEGHCSDYRVGLKESYEHSFCSYHADVSPTNPENGDANTILYAVIPWTAGGYGDHHLPGSDQTSAYDCQDGGYNPASRPIIEEHEEKQPKTKTQEEAEAKTEKTKKEKEAQELKELLEGPHEEEPNQLTTDGPDGSPDTGLSDLIINQIAVQQQNIVTDPLLDAWHDEGGKEVTDECRDFFASGEEGGSVTANEATGAGTLYNQTLKGINYYLNDAFNLAALELPYPGVPCLGGVDLMPKFTSPNPVATGELVAFDGMESDISLNAGTEYSATGEPKPTYAFYKWNFGDGSPEVTGYAPGSPPGNPPTTLCEVPWKAPCASSTFHSYQYGGTYEVTLTVTDTGGNTASVTHQVTVNGPPPPPPPPPPAPPAPPAPTGGSSGSPGAVPQVTTTPASPTVTLPGPVASAAAVASSLKQVTRSGLVVNYKVNEQVAGRFEVLLAAATANSLGIAGHVASELPAGTPRSLVIGQALLVTTKGGHSSVRIKFPKRTAKHLRRARKVTLMLRLRVRNASKSPIFTTVFSTVNLHR